MVVRQPNSSLKHDWDIQSSPILSFSFTVYCAHWNSNFKVFFDTTNVFLKCHNAIFCLCSQLVNTVNWFDMLLQGTQTYYSHTCYESQVCIAKRYISFLWRDIFSIFHIIVKILFNLYRFWWRWYFSFSIWLIAIFLASWHYSCSREVNSEWKTEWCRWIGFGVNHLHTLRACSTLDALRSWLRHYDG